MPIASIVSTVSRRDSPSAPPTIATASESTSAREPLGRGLEGEPGARRLFEEQGGHDLARSVGTSGMERARPRRTPRPPAAPRRCRRRPGPQPEEVAATRRRGRGSQLLPPGLGVTGASLRHQRADRHSVLGLTSTISSRAGRQVLADVVGADRQLAVAPVDHDGQLHATWPGRNRGRECSAARRGAAP